MKRTNRLTSVFCCGGLAVFLAAVASFTAGATPANQLGAVDPLIGTGQMVDGVASCEKGATMPYVGVPFGSVMWVPMTRESQFGTLAFNQQDAKLLGFAASRQMAVAMGEWGEFSFLPTMGTGMPSTDFSARGLTISDKSFTPYSGAVLAGGIMTDYTATAHAAIYKITFPGHVTRQPQIVFDCSRDDMFRRFPNTATNQLGGLTISDGGQTVVAWNTDNTDWYRSRPVPGFKARFRMEFSEKPVGFATYRHVVTRDGTNTVTEAGATSVEADACGATFTFAQSPQVRTIFVKCSVSLVSDANLKSLMDEEIVAWDFDGTLNETQAAWNEKFSLLKFSSGDSDVTKTLATAIYHALQWPRDITEFGSYYSAFDDQVHEGVMFTGQSMWDTYRAENALLGFLAPDRIGGMMKSLVNIAAESGALPFYTNPGETSCMVGAPGEVQLAEAVQKGWLTGADAEAAYAAAKLNATVPTAKDAEVKWRDQEWWTGSVEGRGGLTTYRSLGYVACDWTCQSVSRTQDFSHADDAMARFAAFLGKDEDAAFFAARSHSWTNLWKRDERNVAPRNAAGAWVKPEDCILDGNPYDGAYSESGAAQSRWAVPHDVGTLVRLLGGIDATVRELDAYEASVTRAKDGLVLHDDHSNEPAHHIPYLYNLLGAHDACAKSVREIMADYYPSSRQWRRGHDDCGQMSAWYVFSALGFYPVNPADLTYQIGSPLVDAATLDVGGGKTLRITVNNQAKNNVYVKSVKLNGEELRNRTITHAQIMAGGELAFVMSATPTLAYTLTANKTTANLSFLGDAKSLCINDAMLTYTGIDSSDTKTCGSVNFATDGDDWLLSLSGPNAAFECTAGGYRANFGFPYANAAGRLAIRLTVPAAGWSVAPFRATGGDAKVFFGQNVDFEIDATAVTTTMRVPLASGTDTPGVCFYTGTTAPTDEPCGGPVEQAALARAKVNVAPGVTYAFVREGNALALALTAAGEEEEDPPESQPTSKFDAAHTIICFGDSLTFGSMSDRITVDGRANFFDGRLAGTTKEGCYPYWLSGMVGADYNVVSQCRHGMYSDTITAWQGATEVRNARAFTLKSSAPVNVATNFLFGGTSLGGLGSLPPDDDSVPAAKFGGLLAPTYPLWEEPAVAGSCDSLPPTADGPEWGPSGSLAGTLAGHRVRLVGNRGTNMTIRAIDKLPSGGVTIPAQTPFVPDAATLDPYRRATQVIMCGANDRAQNYQTFLPRIQSATDAVVANGGHFLVISPHVFVTATKNEWGSLYQASDATEHANRLVSATPNRVEKAYAARFGENYLNLRVAMITRGLQIAVAERWLPATTDQTAAGGWARTDGTGLLSSDGAHFSTAGYKVLAYLVHEKLAALGYVEASGTSEWRDIEETRLSGLTEANRAAVEDTLRALKQALGTDAAGVEAWFAKVYGGGLAPAAKVANARNLDLSVEFSLPLMENDPVVTVASSSSSSGKPTFAFSVRDGAVAVSPLTNADLRRLVKYALRLTDGFGPLSGDEVEIATDGTTFTATFAGTAESGFLKVDFAWQPSGVPRLKFGVVSDLHVSMDPDWPTKNVEVPREGWGTELFRTALEWFREQGVDAVVVPGDLTNCGLNGELQLVADVWSDVFPPDSGVERIFILGNHDFDGDYYASEIYPQQATRKGKILMGNIEGNWSSILGEPFASVYARTVKGYTFVAEHWYGETARAVNPKAGRLGEFLASAACPPVAGTKPFFVVEHGHPKGTVYGDLAWGCDQGATASALQGYPNAVVLSGHSHYSLTDERSVWQGAFTSVACGSLRYVGLPDELGVPSEAPVYENGSRVDSLMAGYDGFGDGQGLLVKVYDDGIVYSRRDFARQASLGPDWVQRLPQRGEFAFDLRAAKEAAPQFPAAAELTVAETTATPRNGTTAVAAIALQWPAANANATRPFGYVVTVANGAGAKVERRVYAQGFNRPAGAAAGASQAVLAQSILPSNWREIRVTPFSSLGNQGEPLTFIR